MFKKSNRGKVFRKMIDEANYGPEEYRRNLEYENFKKNSRKHLKNILNRQTFDEYSPIEGLVTHSCLDALIYKEKTGCVEPQYVNHLRFIEHQTDVYRGAIKNLEIQKEYLLKDREFYVNELKQLMTLRNEGKKG